MEGIGPLNFFLDEHCMKNVILMRTVSKLQHVLAKQCDVHDQFVDTELVYTRIFSLI